MYCGSPAGRPACCLPCRHSPNFSKRCTHLLVSADPSDASLLKVYLAGINKDKWHSRAVRMDWLLECANQHKIVAEAPFIVEAPAYEVCSEVKGCFCKTQLFFSSTCNFCRTSVCLIIGFNKLPSPRCLQRAQAAF